jgi:DNA damage-binding protein 1
MCYLDSGYVFLGSKGGDSQLIKLHAEPLPHQNQAGAGIAAAAAGGEDVAAAAAAGGSGSSGGAAAVTAAAAVGDEAPNFVEVVDTWQSLAPIIDFTVMDLERQGQGQVTLQSMIAAPCGLASLLESTVKGCRLLPDA